MDQPMQDQSLQEPSPPAPDATPSESAAAAPPARRLSPLRMIWTEGVKYPRQLAAALLALFTTSAATIAIPAKVAPTM